MDICYRTKNVNFLWQQRTRQQHGIQMFSKSWPLIPAKNVQLMECESWLQMAAKNLPKLFVESWLQVVAKRIANDN